MPRNSPRPHMWKVQGELPHKQYRTWIQHKNQANFREEEYELSFEQYQWLWREKWDMRGRDSNSYCLVRIDPEHPWRLDNVEVIDRTEHLKRQGENRRGKPRKVRGK